MSATRPTPPAPGPAEGQTCKRPAKAWKWGRLEATLFYFVAKAPERKDRGLRVRRRGPVLRFVYGAPADARRQKRYLPRLRQLQRAVNRKLREDGYRERIHSPRDGYLTFGIPPSDLPPPPPLDPVLEAILARLRPPVPKPPPPVPRPPCRRGMSLRECEQFLLAQLARGVCRSRELEHLCCARRGCSRRTYVHARRRLRLRAVRRRDEAGFYWVLVLPAAEPAVA